MTAARGTRLPRCISAAPILERVEDRRRAHLVTPAGSIDADFVIARPASTSISRRGRSCARFARNIATWGDRYTPPKTSATTGSAAFPISRTTTR